MLSCVIIMAISTILSMNDQYEDFNHSTPDDYVCAIDDSCTKFVDKLKRNDLDLATLIDKKGRTALHLACLSACPCAQSHTLLVNSILISAGKNVVALLKVQDNYGKTALHYAAANPNPVIIQLLMEAAGDNQETLSNIQDKQGNTAQYDDRIRAGGPINYARL